MNEAKLCFGEVRHRRLHPVLHAFAYRVYFVRLPLRALETGTFHSRWFSRNRFNLLSFHDSDHGDGRQALTSWADQLLRDEGITDADGEIWLQTFPRVLGYVFNPVSFWFFHRRDGSLRAILCAVNNTFGEKHSYLLDSGASMPYGVEMQAKKIFHVSPFFPIEGDYRFRFMRAIRRTGHPGCNDIESTVARIDYDNAQGHSLHTSVSGLSHPLNNANVLRAFALYPLMTFGVVARIHWQALRLWIKKVPFFKKPAPPIQRVSR